jgi:hypothetical protein
MSCATITGKKKYPPREEKKMKQKILLFALIGVLILSLNACGGSPISTPTSQLPVVSTPTALPKSVVISSTNAFIDSYGTYHVVGEVFNNSNAVVSSIELTIEIKDASGNSLIKDDSGNITANAKASPLLYTLAPGEGSPFEYSYETTEGTPESFNVAISGQQTGTAKRATLNTENVQLVDDGQGWYYLTGELVNTGSQWAHINSLAGAVLNDSNQILSADWTASYATEVAPAGDASGRDRTPFQINFPNPGGATKWHVYMDADVTDSVIDYPLGVSVSNTYFDQYGSFHVVGWLANNSDKLLDSLVVAGIYGADKTVLDSSYSFIPIPIKPGASAAFSVSSFSSINYNPNQASLVSTTSIQADPWFTSPPTNDSVDLAATGETISKTDSTWTFDGSVINTSDKNLSGATVVVMIMDAQNKLIAMEYTSISPTGDAIAQGDTNPYSVSVYLDPAANSSSFTTSTVVIGDVK